MTGSPTKNKILQARIPDALDDELRDRSAELGLSVSSLVRNVLMNTFNLVDGVVSDSVRIAGRLRADESIPAGVAQREQLTSTSSAEVAVVAWQEVILNLNAVCGKCNTILPKGRRAAIGVPSSSRSQVLCLDCLGELLDADDCSEGEH